MWIWVLLTIVACFGLGGLLGAPFLPIRSADLDAALDLGHIKKGQTIIDLGSGDGKLLLAAAKRGAIGIGYEINPLLYAWSKVRTWPYRKQITIYLGDYWHRKLPEADAIYVFLIARFTTRLNDKLVAELQRPTYVISYVFELPKEPIDKTYNTWLYRYP